MLLNSHNVMFCIKLYYNVSFNMENIENVLELLEINILIFISRHFGFGLGWTPDKNGTKTHPTRQTFMFKSGWVECPTEV